jgi:hypothetical protein
MAVGGGDVGGAGDVEGADSGVPQDAHDLWFGAGADLGAVFVLGDVANPVDLVLDVPVAADPLGELRWSGLVRAQVRDGVDVSVVKRFGWSRRCLRRRIWMA